MSGKFFVLRFFVRYSPAPGLHGVEAVHGVTVGVKALLTRYGARVVLLTKQRAAFGQGRRRLTAPGALA